jgi:hypothetical protein
MRRSISKKHVGFVLAGSLAIFLLTGVPTPAADAPAHELVGVKKCKTCHKKEEDGNQFGKWEASAHAKAFETLATPKALEIGKGKGIDNPQTAAECLECHVTAFPVMADIVNQKITMEEGVSCESCHGAGGDYYKKSVMEAIAAGETEPASVGLVLPKEDTCTKCHNDKSPTFEGFKFDEMAKKIAHPKPEAAG